MEQKVSSHNLQQSPKPAMLGMIRFQDDEEEEYIHPKSMWVFLFHKLRDFYVDNIPVELVKQLPKCWKFMIGLCCYCIALLIFIYFTYTNYETAVNQAFISLDSSSGSCTTVPITISDSYYADAFGNWEGSADFLYYDSPFSFMFKEFQAQTAQDYVGMMGAYYTSLHHYGQRSKHFNLASNLVLWMTYIRYYSVGNPYLTDFSKVGRGNLQYAQLSGDPTIVFNSRYSGLALGSASGVCDIAAMVLYDEANGIFRGTINQEIFVNASSCRAVTQPFIFKTNKNVNPYFTIQLDVRSFAVAMGVNLGFNSIQMLMKASKNVIQLQMGPVKYNVGKFFDVRWPTMDAIFCLYNTTALPSTVPQITNLCLVSTGSGLFLPIFNHMGNSLSMPQYCDCQTGVGHSQDCNSFYLMAGLISFPSKSNSSFASASATEDSLKNALTLLAYHGADYAALNLASFNASAATVFATMGSAASSITTPEYLKEAFKFCTAGSSLNCSIITFYTLDQDNTVSPYHYSLTEGSCVDAISPNLTSWEQLVLNPPTSLVQIYYKCISTTSDALINAVGVASGNTSIAMLVLLFVSVPLIFGLLACCRTIPEDPEFKAKEKEICLDTLATMLLRARDRHLEAIDPDGVAVLLTEEMIDAVNFSHRERRAEQRALRKKALQEGAAGGGLGVRSASQISLQEQVVNRSLLGQHHLHRVLANPQKSQLNKIFSKSLDNYSRLKASEELSIADLENGPLVSAGNYLEEDAGKAVEPEEFFSIRVMNNAENDLALQERNNGALAGDPNWLVPYHSKEFEIVIPGLVYYFTEALKHNFVREQKKKSENAAGDFSRSLHMIDVEFARGWVLSHLLIEMDGKSLVDQGEPATFVALANALCMHASLELGKDMRTLSQEEGERIGYQIGDKIFTYSTLVAFSLLNPSQH